MTDEKMARIRELETQLVEVQAQCAAMRMVLEQVEWHEVWAWYRVCPVCAGWASRGHTDNCALAAALAPDAGKALLEDAHQWRNLRPTLQAFARLMESVLRRNDHKPPWREVALDDLLERLYEEVDELAVELVVVGNGTSGRIAAEAADVGNFAMFLADVVGGLECSGTQGDERG